MTEDTHRSPSPIIHPPSPTLGLSSGSLYPDIPTEDIPAVAARLDLPEIEVMLQTAGEYQPVFIEQLRANCQAAGCHVHAVHVMQALHPVFDLYRRRVAEGRALFERAIAGAAELGARALVWHGPRLEEVRTPERWERFVALTAELGATCGAAGVTLALENVSWCALATVRDVAAFAARLSELGETARVGFTFDPFQAAEAGANPFMVLAAMGEHVADVHLSDRREGDPAARHLPPGEGDLPWPALLRAIVGSGYRGPLMIEAAIGDDPDAIRRVRDRLAPLLTAATAGAADVCESDPPPGVVEGIRLFNAREFYECHEVIEHEWHAERGEIRRLYQGILQIGVGFYHARQGNYRGALLLLGDGIEKTSRFTPRCLGIETGQLVAESRACLEQMQALGPDRLAEFDPWMIPVIHFTNE